LGPLHGTTTEIRSHTALNIHSLDGDTPMTRLTGDTADISQLCEFGWYDPMWYIEIKNALQTKRIGRYIGPSHDIGKAMCSKLITHKGNVIVRTFVIPIEQKATFDAELKNALGDRAVGIQIKLLPDEIEDRTYVPYHNDTIRSEDSTMPEVDTFDYDQYHKFIAARASLPSGGVIKQGKVIKRKRDEDGMLIGVANPNTLLDNSLYKVEFDDCVMEEFAVNIITERDYS
jgi:hypothetical protein